MNDIFYLRNKPKQFPNAVQVQSLEDASELSRTRFCWVLDGLNDYTDFDFLYEPKPWEASQTHVWPSQHQQNGGTYLIPHKSLATNYNHNVVPRLETSPIVFVRYYNNSAQYTKLKEAGNNISQTRFFGSFGETLKRIQKNITEPTWVIASLNDYGDFDFTWHPGEYDQSYTHMWPSQHQANGGTVLLQPLVDETGVKHLEQIVQRVDIEYPVIYIDHGNKTDQFDKLSKNHVITKTRFAGTLNETMKRIRSKLSGPTWVISSYNNYTNFDFTWHPEESQEMCTHIWPSQHQPTGGTFIVHGTDADGPNKYHEDIVPRTYVAPIICIDHNNGDALVIPQEYTRARFVNSEAETVNRIKLKLTQRTWIINSLNDYRSFDFTWHPDIFEEEYSHTWPSQHQKNGGTFLVTHDSEDEFNNNVIVPRAHVPPIEFVDHGNDNAGIKFKLIQLANPNAHRTRFVNNESETRHRIHTKCLVPKWYVSSLNDYSDFDFTWHPNEYEVDLIHAYPSQHQRTGGTFLLPKFEYNKLISTKFKKFIVPRTEKAEVLWIEFGDNLGRVVPFAVKDQTRFIETYFGTLKRLMRKETSQYVWVVSSLCDYDKFDFTWHPSEWDEKEFHVFPSNEQKFGDTFYINVQQFNKNAPSIHQLELMPGLHFQDTEVPRYPMPRINHNYDSQVDAVKSIDHLYSMALYCNGECECSDPVTISVWRPDTRYITPLNMGGSCVIVPKDARNYVRGQIYDYPYVDKSHRDQPEHPLDIVFVDNGEDNAEEHYRWLQQCVKDLPNNLYRVSDVDGRLLSMRTAAAVAETAWYFVVNAKLKVNKDFNWNWQPDRLQEKKHYIFYADNPYTGDRYGHMATVAYNRTLVNTNVKYGMDFVMSYKTAVVPILSGTAEYASSNWDAWRTAFRETLKLITALNEDIDNNDEETVQRLYKWLNCRDEWNYKGAVDAKNYYDKVDGDLHEVLKSYEWKWLKAYFHSQYS